MLPSGREGKRVRQVEKDFFVGGRRAFGGVR